MKHKIIGVKWKVFAYFVLFVAILLTLLWTFQTVFLESFYKTVKRYTIKNSVEILSKNIESPDLQEIVDQISVQNEMGVRIIRANEYEIIPSIVSTDDVINQMSSSELFVYYNHALENNGTAFGIIKSEDKLRLEIRFPGLFQTVLSENMVYVKVFNMSDGREAMVALSTKITPIGATVDTLRVQLFCITVILLLLATALALLLARKISKPITTLNEKAKGLAVGTYNEDFCANGYREISELGNTLNYAARELSTVENLRRDLLANISHDLRTPLTLITGYSEAMRDLPGENSPENIQIIIDEANRLTLLVNDIMSLSKLQSGSQQMNFEAFDFTASIIAIVNRLTVLTHPGGYTINFYYDVNVSVRGDEKQLERVAYNLIQNAIEHAGEDKHISVTQRLIDENVRIEVTDNGAGIPNEELLHIWDRYYKLNRTQQNRSLGMGLGLSIVKEILEMHKAVYGVTSIERKGSTFWYELPLYNYTNSAI